MTAGNLATLIGTFVAVITLGWSVIWSLLRRYLDARFETSDTKLVSLETTMDAKLDKLESTMGAKMDALESTMGAKMDALESTMGAKMDALESTMGAKMDALETTVDAKMDALEATVDAKMEAINTMFKAVDIRFDTVDANHEALVRQMADNNRVIVQAITKLTEDQRQLAESQRQTQALLTQLVPTGTADAPDIN